MAEHGFRKIASLFRFAPTRQFLLIAAFLAAAVLFLHVAGRGSGWPVVLIQATVLVLLIGSLVQSGSPVDVDDATWLELTLDASPAAVLVQDAAGKIVLANAAFAELIGCDIARLSGQTIADAVNANVIRAELAEYFVMTDRPAMQWIQRGALWLERAGRETAYIEINQRVIFGRHGQTYFATYCDDLTDRQKLAEERAEHSERARAFLQRVIEVIPQPVYVKDTQSRYLIVNSAFSKQRMLAAEQFIGRSALEFSGNDAEIAAKVMAEDQRVLAGEKVFKEESIIHRVTGEVRYRIITKGTCLDEEGNPVVIGTNFDTTEWRLAENNLKSALATQSRMREFLQSVFDALPNALFVKDEQHHVIMTNRAHAAFLGKAPEDIVGKTSAELIDAERAATIDAFDDEVLQRKVGEVLQKEVDFLDPQGVSKPFIVRKVVSQNVEGQRVILTIHVDLSSLRQAEARWQFALEGAGDGVWDWNVREGRVFYSPRWKAMLGYDETDIGDSMPDCLNLVHPDEAVSSRSDLQAHLDGKTQIYISEHRMRCKNGAYRWVLDRGRVIERDAEGKPVRVIGTHTDITERKRFEDELRRHRDRLQDLVQEKTVDVVLAKETAERANEAKSLFLANMSHELRTPMHAILSFARLGESRAKELPPEKLQSYFERIRTSGDRLLLLLNDLLDLSKLEAGNMVIEMRPLDLQVVIDDVLREYDAWLNAGNLRVVQTRTDCDGLVLGDVTRLGQVVRNLLSNAIKFSPAGSQITLAMQAATLSNGRRAADAGELQAVDLAVIDQGPGIPKNEVDTVFDKFVQSSATRTGSGGTGLGLAICREIVVAHRGQIFARNRDDGGAELIMRIPAASSQSALAAADQAEREDASAQMRAMR